MSEYKYNGIIRSGYLKVDLKNGSALGFMFFGKVGAALQELRNFPTIIFLGGGPGASSQFGSLREIGPLLLQKVFSPTIEDNKYTWAREANLLFIDQPVGTGISCLAGSNFIPTTMADVAVDFYRALNQLYSEDVNGCFNSKNLNISPSGSLYIFGEGYGGKFASAIAAKILAEKNNGGRITGLKGVGIGGGLNSPFRLMSELGNYGFSMSLLDYQERMRMEKIILSAYFYQQNKEWAKMKADFEKAMNYLYDRTGVSYYDITKDGFE